MRTTLSLDDDLLDKAQALTGISEKNPRCSAKPCAP